MTDIEIKANYLEVYADIFKLKEDLKNVQKPINDVVGKFFGTPRDAGLTLAGISEFIGRHTNNLKLADSFFYVRGGGSSGLSLVVDRNKLS